MTPSKPADSFLQDQPIVKSWQTLVFQRDLQGYFQASGSAGNLFLAAQQAATIDFFKQHFS